MAEPERNTEQQENPGFSLTGLFKNFARYGRENTLEALALGTSMTIGGLMATTSLVSPVLGSPYGAAGALGLSVLLLSQNGKTTVANTLGLGHKLGMSAMTLGLIVGSLNTVPEIMVSLSSVYQGAYELGVGNVVGSHIAHTLLILGVTAAAVGISKTEDLSWKFNTYMMAGAAGLFGYQLTMNSFSPVIGGSMLALGGYYLWKRLSRQGQNRGHAHHDHDHDDDHDHDHDHDHTAHNHEHEHGHDHPHDEEEIGLCPFHDHDDEEDVRQAKERPQWFNTLLAGSGMIGLLSASQLMVHAGIGFADTFNTSALGFDFNQAMVGAIIIALGTAAPEIAISIEAIRKKYDDFAVGNILGCSITNTLIAGGVMSFAGGLAGVPVPESFSPDTPMGLLNLGVFAGTTGVLTAGLLATGGAVSRLQGALALAAYSAYIGASLYLSNGEVSNLHSHDHSEDVQNEETMENPAGEPAYPLEPLPSPG